MSAPRSKSSRHASPPMERRTRRRHDRRRAQGLSATVGDVHCAGAARARAARAVAGAVLAAPSDRCGDTSAPREIRAPVRTSRSTCTTTLRRVWRAWRHVRRLTRLPRGARDLVARPAPRSHAQPRPAVRPGAGAGRRAAAGHRAPARAFPAHAGVGHALCRAAARTPLELLGACEGHLDDARLGKARKARDVRLDGDVHARSTPSICATSQAMRPRSTSSITASTRRAFRRPRPRTTGYARWRDPARPRVASSRSAAPSTRRASTTCCTRWRCCRRELHWRLTHIGGGPLLGEARCARRALGIADRVEWRGAQAHGGGARRLSRRRYLRAALPRQRRRRPRRPAQCAARSAEPELACVSTQVSGIPELIDDGVTGVLVEPPRDPPRLPRRSRG